MSLCFTKWTEKIRRPTEHQTFFMDYGMLKDNLSSGKNLDIRCAILPGCNLINALAVLRLKHLWRCHCLLEKGYTRTDIWPYGQRWWAFCFQQWLVACTEEEVWEIGSVQYHCPWVPSWCSHQLIIFRDGKRPAHFISIVTDVFRCYFSSNSYFKWEKMHILIALRTSAFPLVYKSLWVTCLIWSGVAMGLTHWPDMHSSCVHLTSGLCRGVCEPP